MSESSFDVAPPKTPPISVSSATTELNHTGSWKYIQPVYHDRVAPCSAGCPTGVDIQGYMTLLRENRVAQASELLLRENPMPAITGRVCNHPCEEECNRSVFDGAVAIHAVERMLGDVILQSPLPKPVAIRHDERIAVIGSGPAGLACAYHLVRLGYAVEVFEQDDAAGGMLRVGIPEYRLPRVVLDRQIERIAALGVSIHCRVRAGEDISWTRLTTDFAAVFVASGAHISKALQLDNASQGGGVLAGLDFLRAVNRGQRPDLGRRVIVIGGGNTAMDCARTALRLGSDVTVVYRRTRKEMPAIAEEVHDAEREGVDFVFLAAPSRLLSLSGHLTLICKRMKLGDRDAHGRHNPVDSGEPAFPIDADTIITAIGEDTELPVLPAEIRDSHARINEWGSSAIANIFLGGDLAGDTRTVASALGAGKRAALGIDRYLRSCRGESFSEELIDTLSLGGVGALSMVRWTDTDPIKRVNPLNDVVTQDDINTSHFARARRHNDHRTDGAQPFAETNAGITQVEALSEAARCFQCGVCNACELCRIYCGDAAISRDPRGGRFVID
ncbi:MAG TPA: FAD-dependent oxidoreductase, partial [Longimicrobiales bacterium]